MTGSWLGVAASLIFNCLLQKTGFSEFHAKIVGNTGAFCVTSELEITSISVRVAASAFNYTGGQLGLFFKKQGINKLRRMAEGCVDVIIL